MQQRRRNKGLWVGAAVCLGAMVLMAMGPRAHAAEAVPQPLREVEILDRMGAQIPLDLDFYDEQGKKVALSSYFDGERPVMLMFVYYSCPMLCNLLLDGLTNGLKEMEWTPGEQFQIVTISMDPSETSALAAAKKQNYMEEYGRPQAAAGWHWLVGDEPRVAALTDAMGFKYYYDEELEQFAHKAAIYVLTPQGKIARVLDKTLLPGKELKLALLEAGEGKIGSMLDLFFLSCYHYDAEAGSYVPHAMAIMRLAGAATLLILVAVIGTFLWAERRQRRKAAAGAPARSDPPHE